MTNKKRLNALEPYILKALAIGLVQSPAGITCKTLISILKTMDGTPFTQESYQTVPNYFTSNATGVNRGYVAAINVNPSGKRGKFVYNITDEGQIQAQGRITIKPEQPELEVAIPAPIDAALEGRRGSQAVFEAKHVYVLTNPAYDGWVVIGQTKNLKSRISGYNSADPHRAFKLEHSVVLEDYYAAEDKLKAAFESKGEWLKADVNDVIDFINIL